MARIGRRAEPYKARGAREKSSQPRVVSIASLIMRVHG